MTDKPIATEGFTPLKSQVAHARKIADEAQSRLYRKYLKGAEEHAPTVLETDYSLSQLVEFAIDEAIDQLTYLLTLRERMRDGQFVKKGRSYVRPEFHIPQDEDA